MRVLATAIALMLVSATPGCAEAENLSIQLEADGCVDATFHGLEILAAISGDVVLAGDLSCDGKPVRFSAVGSATGTGVRSLIALVSKGWILLDAFGSTVDTHAVRIRSFLYAKRQSLVPLRADDLLEGTHHTAIQIGESTRVYWGPFTGTLAGVLVPAETAGILRLSGHGSLQLSGVWNPVVGLADFSLTIPVDDLDLPAEFLDIVEELFR